MIGRRIGLVEINCEERPSGALASNGPAAKKVYR
jgi:hypothetical protein